MNDGHYTGFRLKDAIVAIACVAGLTLGVSACKDSNPGHVSVSPGVITPSPTAVPGDQFSLNSILDTLQGATTEVQNAVGPHADAVQARTKEEVEKLFRWEYKVVDLPKEQSSAALEAQLQELGSAGWECFSLASIESGMRVTCKRKPHSTLAYLKYIPGL